MRARIVEPRTSNARIEDLWARKCCKNSVIRLLAADTLGLYDEGVLFRAPQHSSEPSNSI